MSVDAKASAGRFVAISESECLWHLHHASLGRLALSKHALPTIALVRLEFSGPLLVIEPILDEHWNVSAGSVVALESSDLDSSSEGGWTVLAQGLLHRHDTSRSISRITTPAQSAFSLEIQVLIGWRFDRPQEN
jgi:hypothetical protein